MRYIAVDANFLIQYRGIEEVPWGDIFDDDAITIVVMLTVAQEVDRFKGDGNARRARRARALSQKLDAVIHADGEQIIVREKTPRVYLKLPPPMNTANFRHDWMTPGKPDHQIISEVLAFAATVGDVILVTGDTGMKINAKHAGLNFMQPPEEWALPPEPDEKDKAINELKSEVKRLSANTPVLVPSLSSMGESIERLRFYNGTIDPLTPAQVKAGMEAIETLFPRERYDSYRPRSQWGNFRGDHDAMEYQRFLSDFESLLVDLHSSLHKARYIQEIIVCLKNDSGIQADGVVVDVQGMGSVLMLGDKLTDRMIEVPEDPKEPERMGGSILDHLRPQEFDPPDPYHFQWRERPEHAQKSASFSCERFRQGTSTGCLLSVGAAIDENQGNGAIKISVTARNSLAPVERTYRIEIVEDAIPLVAAIERYPFSPQTRNILRIAAIAPT